MELPKRKPNRLSDFDYNQNGAYFITICTQDRKRILSKITVGTGVLDCPQIQLLTHGEIADKYIRQLNDYYNHISVDRYVIMPDHIHILLSVQNYPTIKKWFLETYPEIVEFGIEGAA